MKFCNNDWNLHLQTKNYVFLVWLNVKSRDLPQADKKLLQLQAENDNYFHQNYTKDHFETQSH